MTTEARRTEAQSGSGERAKHLADYVAVFRSRWRLGLVVFVLVAAAVFSVALLSTPVFTATVQVRVETAARRGPMAEYFGVQGLPSLETERQAMASYAVAEIAAVDPKAQLTSIIVQENAYRPLETFQRALGIGGGRTCTLTLETEPLANGEYRRHYWFEFLGRNGPVRVISGDDPSDGAVELVPESDYNGGSFEAHGRDFEIDIVDGDPSGLRFKAIVRSPQDTARWLSEHTSAEARLRGASIVHLSVDAETPELAKAMADAVAEAYELTLRQRQESDVNRIVAGMNGRIDEMAATLETRRGELDEYIKDNEAFDVDKEMARLTEGGKNNARRIYDLKETIRLDKLMIEKARNATTLREKIALVESDIMLNRLVTSWLQFEAELERLERDDIKKDSPKYKEAKSHFDEAEIKLNQELDTRLADAISEVEGHLSYRESVLTDVRAEEEQRLLDLNEWLGHRRHISEETKEINYLRGQLERRKNEREDLQRKSLGSPLPARALGSALRPQSRTSPKLAKELLLALGAGLIAALGFILLFEYLDRTVRSSAELEDALGLPILAAIPAHKTLPRRERRTIRGPIVEAENPRSSLAEAYRMLRAKIRFFDRAHRLHVMAITSALGLEGKTLTTANLAASLAGTDSRVLLIDADLRKPATERVLSKYFSEPLTDEDRKYGLSYIVENAMVWKGAVFPTTIEGLYFMPAGANADDPGALLDSPNFVHLLDELKKEFDYILLDVPPILPVADAGAFLRHADGVVLLARYRHCKIETIMRARDQIQQLDGNILGVVFNAYDARRASSAPYDEYLRYGHYAQTPRIRPQSDRNLRAASGGE